MLVAQPQSIEIETQTPTFRVKHPRDIKMFFSDIKREVEVVDRIAFVKLIVIDKIRTMAVDERAESETILPARVEILHVHVVVGRRLSLTPEQETVASRQFCS